jgi:hypothetical protein
LVAVVQRDEHAQQGHERFAAAHIALHEPVHLVAALHVLADLLHHALLCIGGLERQVFGVEVVHQGAHLLEAHALHVAGHQHLLLQ